MQVENYYQRKWGEKMKLKLNRKKVDIALSNKQMTITELARIYGCGRVRMSNILNNDTVTPICAGRLAKALDVKVEQIID